MKLPGISFDTAMTAGMSGKPVASLVASTRVPEASVGHTLAGGGVPFITQLRKCARIAFTVCVCGTGLAGKTPLSAFFPGPGAEARGEATPGAVGVNSPPLAPLLEVRIY